MMLTEFVRHEPDDSVFDENVNPEAHHLNLMVLPFTGHGVPDRVRRFMLPNGQEQPCPHVMFPAVEMERTLGGQQRERR